MDNEQSTDFAARYLARVGHGRELPDRARAGQLPASIRIQELAALIGTDARVLPALQYAVETGELAARITDTPREATAVTFGNPSIIEPKRSILIHRDDARRYFRRLNLLPARDNPLHVWLFGRILDAGNYEDARALGIRLGELLTSASSENEQPTAETEQPQDEADYRQALADIWEKNPMTRIGNFNDGHILDQVTGFPHISRTRRKALAKETARDHADPSVLRTGATPGKRTGKA